MFANLFFTAYYLIQVFLSPGPQSFAVEKIPENLKKGSHAVVRFHETTFTVKNESNAVEKIHYAVTILNENAADYAALTVPYGKFTRISNFKGTLYDKEGKEIKKLKNNEIIDVGGVSGSSLVDDLRLKTGRFANAQYPVTVEFEYEIVYNGLLFYPTWHPQDEFDLAIETASFQIVLPENWVLRRKTFNIEKDPAIASAGTSKSYSWTVNNLPALEEKILQPTLAEITPIVYTAPNTFEIDGFKGDMNSWENFGKWINTLNSNKDKLPQPTVAKVKQLVADAPDDYTRVKRLYEYLQQNTRYVSIQLGIGGWQPFEAGYVDGKGYGDCKALSNYMYALLKVVGINSHYALIKAGSNESDILTDFPSNQFNHAVLCVPMQKDTLWLECTSQTESAGYCGSFTGNRHALLIKPEGGKIVRTPIYGFKENLQKRTADVQLDAMGNATGKIETEYSGLLQDELSHIMHAPHLDQKGWLRKQINIPSFTIQHFEFKQQKKAVPVITEKLTLTVNKCATISGKRLFITPNLFIKRGQKVPADENRIIDIVNDKAYLETDLIRYQIADGGFHPESLPETQNFKSVFGEYSASFKVEDNVITYSRTFKINKGKFQAKAYPELQQFYKKVSQADKLQIVLASKS